MQLSDLSQWSRVEIFGNLMTLAAEHPGMTVEVALETVLADYIAKCEKLEALTPEALAEHAYNTLPNVVTILTGNAPSATLMAIKELKFMTGVPLKSAKEAIHYLKYDILQMPHPTYPDLVPTKEP